MIGKIFLPFSMTSCLLDRLQNRLKSEYGFHRPDTCIQYCKTRLSVIFLHFGGLFSVSDLAFAFAFFSCKKIIERSSIKAMLKWKISILSFSTETVCRRFSFHISSESKSLKIPPKDTWRKNVLWPLISWTSFAVKCALRNHNSEVEIRNKKDPGKSSSIFGWRTTCS